MKEPSFEELKYIIVPLLGVVGLLAMFLPVYQIVSLNSELGYLHGFWLFVTGKVVSQDFFIGIGLILVSVLYFWLLRKYD